MKTVRLLIADDDAVVIESLEVLLTEDPSIRVIGSATDGAWVLTLARDLTPDIVLMDIQMPRMDGIHATARIRDELPRTKVIMLTTFHDYRNIYRSLQAGASGYLLKSDDTARQIATIKAVSEGLPVISEAALKELSRSDTLDGLTVRENETLVHLANGLSNREIAERLYVSEGTVRNNVSVILEKLGLRDRTQLAIHYWRTVGR